MKPSSSDYTSPSSDYTGIRDKQDKDKPSPRKPKQAIKKWQVTAGVRGSCYLGEVEAETAEEAIEKATVEAEGLSFCCECSQWCEDPEVYDAVAEES